jgi:hypothetical protein
MTQAAPTQPTRRPARRFGTRLRSSTGGILIPAAVIGAIASFETARTSGDAQREVFFNIEWPAIMYFIFAASTAIIVGAFVQRLRIWRIGKPQRVFSNFGARLTNALTMGAGTSRASVACHRRPNARLQAHKGSDRGAEGLEHRTRPVRRWPRPYHEPSPATGPRQKPAARADRSVTSAFCPWR